MKNMHKAVIFSLMFSIFLSSSCSIAFALSSSTNGYDNLFDMIATGEDEESIYNDLLAMQETQILINRMIMYGVPIEKATKTYQPGDKGSDILDLKEILQKYGYYSSTATFDDTYNNIMVQRVRMFQTNNGIKVSGIIDVNTHAALLLASAATATGQWYTGEKTTTNASSQDFFSIIEEQSKTLKTQGNKTNMFGSSDVYFAKNFKNEQLLNETTVTLMYDRINLLFSASGCSDMIYQSFSELKMCTEFECDVFDSAPINMTSFDKYITNSPHNCYIDLFESAYIYGNKNQKNIEWDLCPFIFTAKKESGVSVDQTLYIYARYVEKHNDGHDRFTEVYISDPDTVGSIVQKLLNTVSGITKQERQQLEKLI